MPLPRVQVIGNTESPFLYRIGWDTSVKRRDIDALGFDRRIYLQPGAGAHLTQLSGLLRPLVQRGWAAMVAGMNPAATDEARLQNFLFGPPRISLDPIRKDLRKLQDNRCFYCDDRITGQADIDHSIPWARYPDNGIENLVVAHQPCNVMGAVIDEGRQAVLIDGVPQSELSRNPILEPAEQRQIVASFGRGREPQEFDGSDVIEQGLIGRSRRVMEFVHDDDIEVSGVEIRQGCGVQALNRREDMIESHGAITSNPSFSKGSVAEAVAKGGEALIQYLLAVRHEEQACAGQCRSETRVVDRGHDGLTRAGGRDK